MTDRDPHLDPLPEKGEGSGTDRERVKERFKRRRASYAKLLIAERDSAGEGMALVKACKTSDLKPGGAIRVNHKPPIAVYRLNDGFYATDDTCTHAEASLAAGDVDLEECAVECPYHGSFFDIKTGHVLSLPASKPLKTYPVKVVDDEVFVDVG
jgi:3-phenylpropionate/trans-cinnamate dioxygenase ferredoxin subunit